MKRWPLLLLLPLALMGCKKAPTVLADANHTGVDCAHPLIVQADNTSDGLAMQYAWIRGHYPGGEMRGQEVGSCNGKPAFMFTILMPDGKMTTVVFDISSYYGK